jgi:hypothetical protein
MKKICVFLLLIISIISIKAGIIVTRSENQMITKEIYHNNNFAELQDDLLMSR